MGLGDHEVVNSWMKRVGKLKLALRRSIIVKRPNSGHAISVVISHLPVSYFLGAPMHDIMMVASCQRCGFWSRVLVDQGYNNPAIHFRRLKARIDRVLRNTECRDFKKLIQVSKIMES